MEPAEGSKTASKLVHLCDGSYSRAVEIVCALDRCLWTLSFISDRPDLKVKWPDGAYSRINKNDLYERLPFSAELANLMLNKLEAEGMCRNLPGGRLGFDLEIFEPFFLARLLLNGFRPDSDLRYSVMRDIRKRHHCNLSPRIAHVFQSFADALNSYRVEVSPRTKSNNAPETKPKYIWSYTDESLDKHSPPLLQYLKSVAEEVGFQYGERGLADDIELFVECCRSVGYLAPSHRFGKSAHVDIRPATVDAAYLLSNLFGMPTRMRGLDELFGGGGLMLTERVNDDKQNSILGGRSVLIRGHFGTGKTILSLQLAVEVARKGGAAWVMLLEQSYDECRYTLEAMGALRQDASIGVASDILSGYKLLDKRDENRGVLIISRPIKDSFDDFITELSENASRMKNYPFRLISVDPINGIQRENRKPVVLRDQTVKIFEDLKSSGTNIVLVAENGSKSESDLLFEQNITDTVIHLTVDRMHGYAARHFEIEKSRLQREQRGRHPFSIIPGAGVRIYASSAAVSARMRPRATSEHREPIIFGMPALDEIIGENSITSGDVIVFQGAGGSFKTPLGLIFLLGSDKTSSRRNLLPARSLLVSARDDEASIKYVLDQGFIKDHLKEKSHLPERFKTQKDIIICSLPLGYIQPGQVLQRLEDEILDARLKGYWIDRVMIDDVAHWESSSPFISEDKTFGDTLIDFLHRRRVTGLIVCGPTPTGPSVIQRPIIDGSDCLIQFERIEFRGSNRVMLQVLKTRGMRHRRESFEVNLGPTTLDVKPTSSLLRVVRGEIKPARIRLFLNSNGELKKQYSNRVIHSLKSVLSGDTALGPQDLLSQNNVMKLGRLSVVDELQVVQFDEFQLPSLLETGQTDFVLNKFPANQWDNEAWNDFLPHLKQRIRSNDGSFLALPFYENVSLLAYRKKNGFDASQMSWSELAEQCEEWEKRHSGRDDIFFDFPKGNPENYNSLFLEILLEHRGKDTGENKCGFEKLLARSGAIEAGKIYRRLCRKAYLASQISDPQKQSPPATVSKDALVWRHWYTSLNQMLQTFERRDREEVQVRSLPDEVSIAGEWYLGVTAYSAAPDVGLEVMKLLTSHEAELDRLQIGIGLPTRSSFYGDAMGTSRSQRPVSPYVTMSMGLLKDLISKSYKRSDFGCYSQIASTLANHLQRIIAIPDEGEGIIEEKIKENFDSLITRLGFISSELICAKCKWARLPH